MKHSMAKWKCTYEAANAESMPIIRVGMCLESWAAAVRRQFLLVSLETWATQPATSSLAHSDPRGHEGEGQLFGYLCKLLAPSRLFFVEMKLLVRRYVWSQSHGLLARLKSRREVFLEGCDEASGERGASVK